MEQNANDKIIWAPRMPLYLIQRLYTSFAKGIEDEELCDDIGIRFYLRCETFMYAMNGEVKCPKCGSIFQVSKEGTTKCINSNCDWFTNWEIYWQSIREYSALPGRAVEAWKIYYDEYPTKKTFDEKIIAIDQLIHSFHMDEKTNLPAKTVASKLFRGNRRNAVKVLDELSAIDEKNKEKWRNDMLQTIDQKIVKENTKTTHTGLYMQPKR
jgi:hypothetical protein